MPAGYVYAFSTPSMPGIVKIGATDRDPSLRLAEANSSGTWSVPEPYAIAWAVPVDDAFATERAIHLILAPRRVNPRREFFRLTDDDVRALFALVSPVTVAPPSAASGPASCSTHADAADPDGCGTTASAQLQKGSSQTPEGRLKAWVEEHYTHVQPRAKDSGTKLEALYAAYTTAVPSVHTKLLGRNKFAKMLNAVFPNIGPYRNTTNTISSLYLLR